MDREEVDSTSLRSIGYDSVDSTLEVEFIKGRVYCYLDVPQHVYAAVMAADSIGAAFSKLVKSGGYVHSRVN